MPDENEITLIEPGGGRLVDLVEPPESRDDLKRLASELDSIQVSDRVLCDLELLATGAFSPLDRFMGRTDYESVLGEMRLAGGALFPIPITLPIEDDAPVEEGRDVVLRDAKNRPLAVLSVEEIYEWDREAFARNVAGTTDPRHPLVAELGRWGDRFAAGPVRVLDLPVHHDFTELRMTPAETREGLRGLGHGNVVAFQTRNPLHRVHEELTKRAVESVDGSLLLHPAVGMTKPGDVDHYTRVRTYRALASSYYEPDRILLALVPLAMRMAGPREALWHAIVRRNYGANHFVVGRDHASPGVDSEGNPFYGPYDAQELLERHADELGVTPVTFSELVYWADEGRYEEASKVPDDATVSSISGTQVREEYLQRGEPLPDWFTRPEVAEILSETHPPRHRQGVCVWFTGLSGAGKSTTAEVLTPLLLEHGRQVTVLDGDVVRTHLSKGLGFTKDDRDTNVRRIGFVAGELVRHGGTVVCAAVSPYRETRNDVRAMIGAEHFVEVFVDTPLEVCEDRDVKGMYAKARRGEIENFTGIDDPYERPEDPEIVIDTVNHDAEGNARRIVEYLVERGFVRALEGYEAGS